MRSNSCIDSLHVHLVWACHASAQEQDMIDEDGLKLAIVISCSHYGLFLWMIFSLLTSLVVWWFEGDRNCIVYEGLDFDSNNVSNSCYLRGPEGTCECMSARAEVNNDYIHDRSLGCC